MSAVIASVPPSIPPFLPGDRPPADDAACGDGAGRQVGPCRHHCTASMPRTEPDLGTGSFAPCRPPPPPPPPATLHPGDEERQILLPRRSNKTTRRRAAQPPTMFTGQGGIYLRQAAMLPVSGEQQSRGVALFCERRHGRGVLCRSRPPGPITNTGDVRHDTNVLYDVPGHQPKRADRPPRPSAGTSVN